MDIFNKKIVCNVTVIIFITLIYYAWTDVNIKEIARSLSEDVEQIKKDELGVPFILKLYGNFMYLPGNMDVLKNVKGMAHKLEAKITDIFSALVNSKTVIENVVISENITGLSSALIPCFPRDSTELPHINQFIENITIVDPLESAYVLEKMRRNMGSMSNAVKRLYFISDFEVKQLQYTPFSECSGCDETILWKNYMIRNNYQRKNVILILDNGGSLNSAQFSIVKAVAKKVISVLKTDDRIALITIGSNYTYLESDCGELKDLHSLDSRLELKPAIATRIQIFNNYIDALSTESGITNHLLGIQKGLEIILNDKEVLKNETVMVLYVSRGLLSSLMEPTKVLEMIAQFTSTNNISLVINTCAVVDDLKPIMYELQFLRDIAQQNYSKYNISYKPNTFRKVGLMLTVNSTENVPFVVNHFYSIFNPLSMFKVDNDLSLPNWDLNSDDLTVSFTKGWMLRDHFALLGVDIYFSNLVEDIKYYSSNQDYSYTFLMDLNGNILFHPSFLRPSIINHDLLFIDLEHFEKVSDIAVLKKRLLSEESGIHETYKNNQTELIKFTWSRVGDWYIMCIVVNTKYGPSRRPYRSYSASGSKFLFHNLEDYKVCRHLNLLATVDVTSLYLSSSCFQSPFFAARTTQDKLIAQGYLAYLKDDTRLLANPGLKEEVRDEVAALSHVLDFLRKRHLSSIMSKYVVRRYASSYTGVLQMFPGSVLQPGLKPTKRPWFLRALQHKGKLVLISPYLDKGGAGYIVTAAYATSQLVVAIDITYGYMLKMLLKYTPECLNEKVTCFLIDDQGYIIYHPNLMDVNGARPVEQQHIVHKESLVSNDILNHKHFIRKLLCNNYGDNTIQRYYRLNTSFTDVLVNFVPGEHCVTYRITSVPNTNFFVGLVNASCDFVATFCPCSIVDRLCLNCNRMEQKECECPCECPLDNEDDFCENKLTNKNITDNQPCMWYVEESSLESTFTIDTGSHLEPCFPINCQTQKTHLDCLGLIGCEWCRYDMERNYLRKPFCASISTCFNGVFDITMSYSGDMTADSDYSPVGPILGSIIALCVLFILLLICYRSYTNPLTERLYLSSTQDQLRMSDINVNDNFHDSGNHTDRLLQEERPNVISPYCVASTYRRNAVPADSDHGYSTMTPHDESEHLSLAPVEVDSLEDDVMSDSTSIHTSISAKDVPRVLSPMFTKIPNRNCIVVPVTVHRNMEKT